MISPIIMIKNDPLKLKPVSLILILSGIFFILICLGVNKIRADLYFVKFPFRFATFSHNLSPLCFKPAIISPKKIAPEEKPTSPELGAEQNRNPKTKATSIYSRRLPILMYHYISVAPTTSTLPGLYLEPAIFENQLQTIKAEKFQLLYISDIAKILNQTSTLPSKPLALTFDDGYQDFYTQAWPLLKKYNLKSTLYVIINDLDKPGYLSSAELKELASSGLVEIGSHTFNHPNLKILNPRQADYEIRLSRLALERLSGQSISSFAYPFGLYDYRDIKFVTGGGYTAGVSTNIGSDQALNNIMSLKRLRPGTRQGSDFIKWLKAWE